MRIYKAFSQAFSMIRVSIALFKIWPFHTWLVFWASRKPEQIVVINGIKVAIRSQNIFSKTADISMAYECMIRDDYKLKNLSMPKGSVMLDIGGHIGSFSLVAAKKYPRAKIFSFEPSPSSYGMLKKNIALNNYKNIVPINKAVSSDKKTVPIYLNPLNSAANSIYLDKGFFVEVPAISLEKMFKNYKIKECEFIKMDCEGAEYDIILNAPVEILRKIKAMVIEYHDPDHFKVPKKYTLSSLINYLEKAGFKCDIKKMKRYQGLLIANR